MPKVSEYRFPQMNQVTSLASAVHVKTDSGERIELDPQRLYQRLLVTGICDIPMHDLLKYELCSLPTCRFVDAHWRQNRAHVLSHQTCVRMYLFYYSQQWDAVHYRWGWPKNSIYADICRMYTQYVVNTYSDAVVVFDGYYGGASTKVETHRRRAKNYRHTLVHLSADRLFLPTHQTKRPWLTLLHYTCPVQASLKNIPKEMLAGMFICERQTNSCCCRWHWCVSAVGTPCWFHQSHCWTIDHVYGDLQRDHLHSNSRITWTIPLYDHCSSYMLLVVAIPHRGPTGLERWLLFPSMQHWVELQMCSCLLKLTLQS